MSEDESSDAILSLGTPSSSGLVNSQVSEDRRGLRISSGVVTLQKDKHNLVGISIGGGAPHCPCLYVVQVFENTPAAKDGSLASGDEICSINGINVKGFTKSSVSRLIQNQKKIVTISYNKLHVDAKQGRTFDIRLKHVKHRVVESLGPQAADTLGLSRAILVNDSLVSKLENMEETGDFFAAMVPCIKKMMSEIYELAQVHKEFGAVLTQVACKEPQMNASEAFSDFGGKHLAMEKFALDSLQQLSPIMQDISLFTKVVIPDMKMTMKKYLDAKFLYLSYCLKVKEMDDEEYEFFALNESLYRVETGNYEYRVTLRSRQEARKRFAKIRNDVYEKLELLDNKRVQDIVTQLQRLINALNTYYKACYESLKSAQIFPIELHLNYMRNESPIQDEDNEDEPPLPILEEKSSLEDTSEAILFDLNDTVSQSTEKEEPQISPPLNPKSSDELLLDLS